MAYDFDSRWSACLQAVTLDALPDDVKDTGAQKEWRSLRHLASGGPRAGVMDDRDSDGACQEQCTEPGGHTWQLIRADRVPHQYWPPYAELTYRCGHCGSQRHVRQTLRK